MKKLALIVVSVIVCACAPASSPNNSGTNSGAKPLGSASITLRVNKITNEQGHYGVYLWVEKVAGASASFVKTLSWYFDWGLSGSDGGKFTVNGTSANHLAQSQTWRTAGNVTTNGTAAFDAYTSATINTGIGGSSPLTVTFDGTVDTKSKLNGTTPDEYFAKAFTNKFQGWDGRDSAGNPVSAGTYRFHLGISRHYSGSPLSPLPYFTEYIADVAVGTASSAPVAFSVVQAGGTTAGGAGDEVAVGSGGPVLTLANSTVTYNAAP